MRVSVFGLGYVGCVSAACFAMEGHQVTGVDVNSTKVEIIKSGNSPIVETGMGDLIREMVALERLTATTDTLRAIRSSDVSLVCVGTPSKPNGSLDLTYVQRVCEHIGAALAEKDTRHVVVIRSTMLPGTIESTVVPALEEYSGKVAGVGFGICINPEFLREGTSLKDFYAPPFTIIGADDESTAAIVRQLYKGIDAPVFVTALKTAEMVKYVCNCFHALKVSFANEVGNLCKGVGIDSHEVMNVFCQDTKLNLSSYYLKPGFAFGGACLPKDLRAINYKARSLDLDLPLLGSILPSNEKQTTRGFEMIQQLGKRPVSILGMSFKAGTDDLRESPVLEIIERLIGKGYDVRIFDRNVNLSKLVGANRDYLLGMIPHVSSLLVESLDEALSYGEIIVIGNGDPEFRSIAPRIRPDQFVIDLVRIQDHSSLDGRYDGISW